MWGSKQVEMAQREVALSGGERKQWTKKKESKSNDNKVVTITLAITNLDCGNFPPNHAYYSCE